MPVAPMPMVSTAPVLAIVVCHNGESWLPLTLSALRRGTIRPRHILAVDTGSTDSTPDILAAAREPDEYSGSAVLDGVLTMPSATGFAAAVHAAVDHAQDRWGDPGRWIWLLHDDCAPAPACLDRLLRAAEAAPTAAVLGPLAVSWSDPQVVVEAGLSTDASGHRRDAGLRQAAVADRSDRSDSTGHFGFEQSTEVLAVPSAGALISRAVWTDIGGMDPEIPLLGEDIDFGWRVNAVNKVVLCVPRARLRHARAIPAEERDVHAVEAPIPTVQRSWGVRTYLANCSPAAFVLGLVRIFLLCLVRGAGFAVLGKRSRAHTEFSTIGFLFRGRAKLRAARADRTPGNRQWRAHGLLIGRTTRLRYALQRGASAFRPGRARKAGQSTVPLLPHDASVWTPPEDRDPKPGLVGPDAVPAGALRATGTFRIRTLGLRRPATATDLALPEQREPVDDITGAPTEPSDTRPSPGVPRPVEIDAPEPSGAWWRKRLRRVLGSPSLVLLFILTAYALVLNGSRLSLDLAGGSLLPVGDLASTWSTYLESWHGVAGGTAGAASPALAVLGIFGAPLASFGGPAALVALLIIGDIPLAALSAYAATRRVPVHRWIRAGIAAGYGLLPPATISATQGRVDVVVVHLLLPIVLAGIAAVLTRSGSGWLSRSVLCALALAVAGAFSPLAYGLGLAVLALGFVILPRPRSGLLRSSAAVAIVIVLPLLLLLPWIPALSTRPGLLLQGFNGVSELRPAATDLVVLNPGGATIPAIGVVVVVAAIVAVLIRPSRDAVPGFVLSSLGIVGAAFLRSVDVTPVQGGAPAPGLTAIALLFAGAGLLAMVLGTCGAPGRALPAPVTRFGVTGAVALLLVLAVGHVPTSRDGSLQDAEEMRLASSLEAELADTGRSVLVLDETARQSAGRQPQAGDDVIVPASGAESRLGSWQNTLLSGSPEALGSAAAAGVLFIVLPDGVDGEQLRQSAPELLDSAPRTNDGRDVVRLTPVAGQITLISAEQARRAVEGEAPDPELMDGDAVAAIDAELPDVQLQVSDGPEGRLLVLAGEYESGWQARVNGEEAPIVRAWDHHVAVAVPPRESDVVVEYSAPEHMVLLLVQLAVALFAALTAIPGGRSPQVVPPVSHSPSMISGSTPR